MIKEIITGENLQTKLIEAVNLLCNTAANTLGPIGSNVIISTNDLNPYITNDGVTIAQSIGSNDPFLNAILTLVKESSIKTNEDVGDGTTTTLVLLQYIFNEGINLINKGYSGINLKKEINIAVDEVINNLKKEIMKPKKEDYFHIALISSGSESIGQLISEVYEKTNLIYLKESSNNLTYYEIIQGYEIDTILGSNLFLSNQKEICLNEAYLLLLNKEIEDIDEINNLLNEVILEKRDLLIIADDYDKDVLNQLLLYNYQKTLNVVAIKNPECGRRKYDLLNDLAILSGSEVINQNINLNITKTGIIKSIKINLTNTLIMGKNIHNTHELEKELASCQDYYEKEYLDKRIAKLNKGIGIIYVGGNTKTEMKEKKMRFEDGLRAIEVSKEGILPGEGLSLIKIKKQLKATNGGEKIVFNSLNKPFQTIIKNVGLKPNKIYKKIKKDNFQKIYNIFENEYEDIQTTKILDPYKVIFYALINASSIAGLLLTTNALIINENNITVNLNNFNNEI